MKKRGKAVSVGKNGDAGGCGPFGTMLLAAALGVCALAASDVPKAVLNARESVVRIMTEGAMGSGFALSENSVYVVTNHHVIEGAETIEVIVDDTRWTTARVYVDLPGKDICILKNRQAPARHARAAAPLGRG